MITQLVSVSLLSEWHIGSGEGAGAYADALTLKNHHGLPFIPGKSLKGLFREAMQQGIESGWFPSELNLMDALFGEEGQAMTTQGALQFSSANLSALETAYLVQHPEQRKGMFRVLQSTALDPQTGVAKNKSLRSIEVVNPMCLTAQISLNPQHKAAAALADYPVSLCLQHASQLILSLGAKRHRGLGQVQMTLTDLTNEGRFVHQELSVLNGQKNAKQGERG